MLLQSCLATLIPVLAEGSGCRVSWRGATGGRLPLRCPRDTISGCRIPVAHACPDGISGPPLLAWAGLRLGGRDGPSGPVLLGPRLPLPLLGSVPGTPLRSSPLCPLRASVGIAGEGPSTARGPFSRAGRLQLRLCRPVSLPDASAAAVGRSSQALRADGRSAWSPLWTLSMDSAPEGGRRPGQGGWPPSEGPFRSDHIFLASSPLTLRSSGQRRPLLPGPTGLLAAVRGVPLGGWYHPRGLQTPFPASAAVVQGRAGDRPSRRL